MAKPLTYKDAGVDIDTANRFIERIKPFVKRTERPEVLSSVGHYAGLFRLDMGKFRDPILVSSTDGVGTKLKLALEWNRLEGLGQDLVAMSANDILCLGAEPLFFLDYFATGHLDVGRATTILEGIANACREVGCSLLGGETAEMPKIYRGDDFDLAGFIVGVVERDAIIDGSQIAVGDRLIGLASSGFHSNGFSMVRKIVATKKLVPQKKYPGLSRPLGEILLEPTFLYGKAVLALKHSFSLHGIAHITGGGLLENIPRILPPPCRAVIHEGTWPRPAVFQLIQKWGRMEDEEMCRVFNCGLGLILVVPAGESAGCLEEIRKSHEAWVVGEVVSRQGQDAPIEIV